MLNRIPFHNKEIAETLLPFLYEENFHFPIDFFDQFQIENFALRTSVEFDINEKKSLLQNEKENYNNKINNKNNNKNNINNNNSDNDNDNKINFNNNDNNVGNNVNIDENFILEQLNDVFHPCYVLSVIQVYFFNTNFIFNFSF